MSHKLPAENRRLIEIPFPGLYESSITHEIDNIIDTEIAELLYLEHLYPDYKDCETSYNTDLIGKYYAQHYIELLSEELGFTPLHEFESIVSPQYYNYSTDRLFIYVGQREAKLIQKHIEKNYKEKLNEKIKHWTTSRSGFIPSYTEEKMREVAFNSDEEAVIAGVYLTAMEEDIAEQKKAWEYIMSEEAVNKMVEYGELYECITFHGELEAARERRNQAGD